MAKKKSQEVPMTPDQMYLDACSKLGRTPMTLEHFAHFPEEERQAFYSLYRITTVIKAVKAGHVFDWNSYKAEDRKYFPWWDMETYDGDAPGSGFRLDDVYFNFTYSNVGVRLSSKSDADTRNIAQIMQPDYKNWMKE